MEKHNKMFCFNLTQKETGKILEQNKCISHLLSCLAKGRGARTHGPQPIGCMIYI